MAAALFLLPCSCAQASLRMTKLFHASVKLGIVSLFYRYRLTGGPKLTLRSPRSGCTFGQTYKLIADFGFGTLERPQEIQKILLLVRL